MYRPYASTLIDSARCWLAAYDKSKLLSCSSSAYIFLTILVAALFGLRSVMKARLMRAQLMSIVF